MIRNGVQTSNFKNRDSITGRVCVPSDYGIKTEWLRCFYGSEVHTVFRTVYSQQRYARTYILFLFLQGISRLETRLSDCDSIRGLQNRCMQVYLAKPPSGSKTGDEVHENAMAKLVSGAGLLTLWTPRSTESYVLCFDSS